MQFVCFADWSQLPESANALFAQAEKDSVFFSRPWFENLVEHALEDGQSMLLACVLDGDRVLAMLPMLKGDGDHWRSLGHLYTSLFSILLVNGGPGNDRQEILTSLVRGLEQLPVNSLRLAPIADDDGGLHALQKTMESSGFFCHRYFRFYNWIHRVQGQSFDDYMAARPARVRNTIARKQRKLEREHGYHVRLYMSGDLRQAKADYNAVYGSSWKARELFTEFVDGLADTLAARGWLRLAILYVGEAPAAAQFWFVVKRKASIFRLAYDERWKQYSPGSILIKYLMEQVIETDQVDEIDFLTGNDAYKQDWMSERRERWGLYCARARQPQTRTDGFIGSLGEWARRFRLFSGQRRLPLNQPGITFHKLIIILALWRRHSYKNTSSGAPRFLKSSTMR